MPSSIVLARPVEAELVERRSRFLARLEPVHQIGAADEAIRRARAEHPSARHHCSAMVIGTGASRVTRSNDDGEPSGTAGMPMLQTLLGAGVTDLVAVVVRYFGCVKLGTGGLARAYAGAVSLALQEATYARRECVAVLELPVPLATVGVTENALRAWAAEHDAVVEPTAYRPDGAVLTVLVAEPDIPALHADVAAWSSGDLQTRRVGDRTVDRPHRP